MTRQMKKVFKTTWTCDQCSKTVEGELTEVQLEIEDYQGGNNLPPGWLAAHIDRPNTYGKNIPTHQFCGSECRLAFLVDYFEGIKDSFFL